MKDFIAQKVILLFACHEAWEDPRFPYGQLLTQYKLLLLNMVNYDIADYDFVSRFQVNPFYLLYD